MGEVSLMLMVIPTGFYDDLFGIVVHRQLWRVYPVLSINNIEPHEAVPEVSKGKVHITQNKHVPIKIGCDFLNTFHSISHATLS